MKMYYKLKTLLKQNSKIVQLYEETMVFRHFVTATKAYYKEYRSLTKWDRDRIRKFKDKHKGERCFIVGTGPCLTLDELNRIKNEKSFGVNSAFLAYESTEWRPNYYVVMDENAFDVFGKDCYTTEIYEAFFVRELCREKIPNKVSLAVNASNHFLINTFWNRYFRRFFPVARFSSNIEKVVYAGKTVVYAAIQIAAYMGFTDIYLLGIDCNYEDVDKHSSIMAYATKGYVSKERYVNNGKMMRIQFEELKRRLPPHIHVYNASAKSKLDIFPRAELDQLNL